MKTTTVAHYLALAALTLFPPTALAQANSVGFGEDGSPVPAASAGVSFIEGTAIDQALAPALTSAAPVPVIIVLRDQPLHRIAADVQARYLPQVEQRSAAVRAILAEYAGPRNFASEEEMRAQAKREAEAVSPADRALKNRLNQETDELLGRMRKEIHNRVKAAVGAGQAAVSAAVASHGGKVSYGCAVLNAVAAVVPGTAIEELSRHPLVSHVIADRVFDAHLNVSGPSIFVNTFWSAGENGGVYDCAIIDSGVDTAHAALDDDTVGTRTWFSQTFHAQGQTQPGYNDNPGTTDDLRGHGTHVAGIVFSSNSMYRGVAFGADIGMNLKAAWLGTDGRAHTMLGDVMAAMDWAQAHSQEPEVVNFSYGADATADDDDYCRFFDAYIESQICTATISAGNDGPSSDTVGTPGIAYNCLCVANVDDKDTTNRADDLISTSSSRGPTDGGRRKPDIAAPGTYIWSANCFWETASDFVERSGTSMAAPQIAGAALLLNDAGVTNPLMVKAVLINTADDWGDPGWDSAYGFGYVNLDRAYLHRSDVFLHSVYPRQTAGDYHLYRTTGMDSGETATMTWYRHAVYNGASVPTTIYSLNDLNLRLYDEATGDLIASELDNINNVHQVRSDRSGTQVIRAYAWSTSFSHGSTETYALATQEGTTLVTAEPTVTPSSSNYTPPLYSEFYVTVRVDNTGEIAAHNVSVTLSLPSGVVLAEGSLTRNIGTIAAGSYGYVQYKLDTTSSGTKTVNMSTTSSSYGLTYTGGGSFTVTPGPQDTVAPYTTMRITGPVFRDGGTDKVTNGGFESELTSWTTSGTAAVESTSPHSGTYNLVLGPGSATAYQTVSINSGAYATLNFWYKCSASAFAGVGCRITDTSGNILNIPFSAHSSVTSWTMVTIDVGRFGGQTIRLYFYSSYSGLGSSTMRVDDVALTENEYIAVDDTTSLSLVARDENSGIDYTEYHIGSDPFMTYTEPFTLAGWSEGYRYIYYRSVDNGANIEPTVIKRLDLDTIAPKSVMEVDGGCAVSGGTEKVANGGFESLLASWTAVGTATTTTDPVHSGSRAAQIGATGPGSIYQDVSIPSGASKVFLTAWVRSVGGTGPTYCAIRIIDPVTGVQCFSKGWNFDLDWQKYAWDVSGFAGQSVRIEFAVVWYTQGTATLYVDDVSIRQGATARVGPSNSLTIYATDRTGIKKYERNVDSAGYVQGQSFSVAGPGAHTVLYRAFDNLDHQGSTASTELLMDSTGPTGSIVINSGAEYATSPNVSLSLSATDPAGVSLMRIRSDAGIWGAWQPYASSFGYTLATLGEGTKTLAVEYQDALGNISSTYTDSIKYRIPVPTDIPGAKMVTDDRGVRLEYKLVTAIFPSSGYFYIEEPDRRSGIRVRSETLPEIIGARVTVEGVTDTVYAEREIVATVVAGGGIFPELAPLGVTNRAVGGGAFHYQPGATNAVGLNNTGLLVRTTGRVVKHYAGAFYIDDGSSLTSPFPAHPTLLVDTQALSGWLPPLGAYVSLTGISGMETISRQPIPIVRPRGVNDIEIRGFDAAYVYYKDPTLAASFKSLLDGENVKTDLVYMGNLGSVDLSPYEVILIGNDTGEWADAGKVTAVLSAGKPVVAIGQGGGWFLDRVPDLYSGWMNSAVFSSNQGKVVTREIFTYPHDLGVSPGDTVTVYSSVVSALGLFDTEMRTIHMLRHTSMSAYYYIVREGTFYMWGFYGPPSAMTQTGRDLFTNLVFRAVMP